MTPGESAPAAGTRHARARSARRWSRWTGSASRRAATSPHSASCAAPASCTSTAGPPRRSPAVAELRASRSVRSSGSPTSGHHMHRSAPPPCSRRRRGSSASPPSRRCWWRSGCTRTATSPICGPTRRRWLADRDRRGPPAGARPLRRVLRPGQAACLRQQGEERAGGARGDPGRPATTSVPRSRSRATACPGTSSGCTTWFGKRTVASQMKDATGESVSVRVAGTSSAGENAEFGASGNVIKFYGFLKAYVEGADDPNADRDDRERRLPPLASSDPLAVLRLEAARARDPAARAVHRGLAGQGARRPGDRPAVDVRVDTSARSWTVATCSRRAPRSSPPTSPSPWSPCWSGTSASWWTTSSPRGWKACWTRSRTARRHVCRGCAGSTSAGTSPARPAGRRTAPPHGDAANGTSVGGAGLKALVSDIDDIDPREVSSFPLEGTDITVRVGRYGPYLERDGQRAQRARGHGAGRADAGAGQELLSQPNEDVVLGTDPGTGLQVVAKTGRFGPYRHRAAPRRRAGVGQAAYRLAAEVDVAGHGDPGRRAEAAQPAAGHR